MPDEASGHFYVDLDEGLTSLFDFAEREGETVPPEARTNTEPLRSLVVYGEQDGERTRLTGFLSIE